MLAASWVGTFKSVAVGQLVPLFSILTLMTAKFLAVRGVSVPGLLSLFFYVVLAMLCISYAWIRECNDGSRQRQDTSLSPSMDSLPITPTEVKTELDQPRDVSSPRAKAPWWMYPLAALLDVEANYSAVRALAFTNYATVGLMLNLSVPFLSLLHYGIDRNRCTWVHIVGCVIALTSIIPLFVGSHQLDHSDGKADKDASSYQVYGTLLAFMAAFLHAASNIASQWCLRDRTLDETVEGIGFIAVCSTIFSLIHFFVMEVATASAIKWDTDIGLGFVGYASSMITVYALVAYMMQSCEATWYIVSLFASNLYLLATSYYCFGESASCLGAIALALILLGLGLLALDLKHSSVPKPLPSLSQKLCVSGFDCMSSPHPIAPIKLIAPHAVV